MVKSWFVVEIIRMSVMVSIVFVSRVTMGFVMLFAINATGLLGRKSRAIFLLPVSPWSHEALQMTK